MSSFGYRPFYGEAKLEILELIRQVENGVEPIDKLLGKLIEIIGSAGSRVEVPIDSHNRNLEVLTAMLPWSSRNRYKNIEVGTPYSATKRSDLQNIPSTRVLSLERVLPLQGLLVADVGCYEGVDAISLVDCGARVFGFDFQIENIVKSVVYAWLCGAIDQTKFALCDVDERQLIPALRSLSASRVDLVYASGLIYHLTSPEKFISECAEISSSVYISTQLAEPDESIEVAVLDGQVLKGKRVEEPDAGPFRGAKKYGVWFTRQSLFDAAARVGLRQVEIISETKERNGPRIDVLFSRRKKSSQKPLKLESRYSLEMDVGVSDGLKSVVRLGPPPTSRLLVVGPAKSGTSLLVKILEQFGYWNPGKDSIVGEVKISDPNSLESYMYSLFAFLDRCEQPCVVKSPKLADSSIVEDVKNRLECSPHLTLIALFRNPLSIARRRSLEKQGDMSLFLEQLEVADTATRNLGMLVGVTNSRLLVSGDDLLEKPEVVAQQIAEELNVPVTQHFDRLIRNATSWKSSYSDKHDFKS